MPCWPLNLYLVNMPLPVCFANCPALFYDILDSTNDEAMRLSKNGQKGPLWIVAKRQSAGRGRQQRQWHSPQGNFYASLLFAPNIPSKRRGECSFLAALAVHSALLKLACVKPELKWPNDVLVAGKKIAGILLETTFSGARKELEHNIIIGIGVNLVSHPAPSQVFQPTTDLYTHTGKIIDHTRFLSVLAPAMDYWHQIYRQYGFAPLRKAWMENCCHIHDMITLQIGRKQLTGQFAAVEADGGLAIFTSEGRQIIYGGEILYSPAMATKSTPT